MRILQDFLVGGYAYYRKKRFSHDSAVTMLTLAVYAMPALIALGLTDHFFITKADVFDSYGIELGVIFVVVFMIVSHRLDKYLNTYKDKNYLNEFSREIRLHSILIYLMVIVNFFVWYYLR